MEEEKEEKEEGEEEEGEDEEGEEEEEEERLVGEGQDVAATQTPDVLTRTVPKGDSNEVAVCEERVITLDTAPTPEKTRGLISKA